MLTIPLITSSCGASAITSRAKDRRKTTEHPCGGRGTNVTPNTQERTWHGIVLETLKRNDIRLVPYVPDRVLTTLIRNIHADPFFTTFPARARRKRSASFRARGWGACAAPC